MKAETWSPGSGRPSPPSKERDIQIQRHNRDSGEVDNEMRSQRASNCVAQLFDSRKIL